MIKNTLVLGSKSPRRQALIGELGFPVEIRTDEIDEIYPDDLAPEKVPAYLAKLKAQPLIPTLKDHEILVTSDTIVLLDGQVVGKPKDSNESIEMLRSLSGRPHTVITGVHLASKAKTDTFSTRTEVYFSEIAEADILHYVNEHKPFDKAGSYGIQEWLGYIGVSKIDGCYYNVMGLPLHDLYKALKAF
ncbi:MAG: Maf family nucleotide pyrophosphatase [Fluviicola sp.]